MPRPRQRIQALLVALLAFTSCAPPMAVPPPSPMTTAPTSFGFAGAVGVSPGGPQWADPNDYYDLGPTFDAQGWVLLGREGHPCQVGAVFFAGTSEQVGDYNPGYLGIGEIARCNFSTHDRWYVGPQVEAGLIWAGIGAQVGFLAGPDLLIYTSPTYRVLAGQPLLLPLGVAWRPGSDAWVTAEAGIRGGPPGLPLQELGYMDGQVAYVAVGGRY